MDNNSRCLPAILQNDEFACSPNTLRNMMRIQPDLLNSVNSDGDTPLHFLLRNSQPYELINELLQLGADVNFPGPSSSTPLHYAVKFLSVDVMLKVVQLLIKYGANVNKRDKDNHSPLHVLLDNVKGNKHLQVIKFLLINGINTDHESEHFTSYLLYLFFCIRKVNLILKISRMLLEFGAKPDRMLINYVMSFPVFDHYSLQLVKLLMQYILINYFKTINCNGIKLVCSNDYLSCSLDQHMTHYNELTRYRESLIRELIMMLEDKIDEKESLFSFILVHCSSGDTFTSSLPVICQVISRFHSNGYVCCKDLFRASMKKNALLPVLLNLRISAKEHLSETSEQNYCAKVLTLDTNLLLSAYLSKNDILNLILASKNQTKENKYISAERCSRRNSKRKVHLFGSTKVLKKRIKLDI